MQRSRFSLAFVVIIPPNISFKWRVPKSTLSALRVLEGTDRRVDCLHDCKNTWICNEPLCSQAGLISLFLVFWFGLMALVQPGHCFEFVLAPTLTGFSSSSSLPSTRGPPDISSLVPIGPKYTMKWSAPLHQVQVVEVGQEGPQPGKDALYHQGGAKRPSGVCASGKRCVITPLFLFSAFFL